MPPMGLALSGNEVLNAQLSVKDLKQRWAFCCHYSAMRWCLVNHCQGLLPIDGCLGQSRVCLTRFTSTTTWFDCQVFSINNILFFDCLRIIAL